MGWVVSELFVLGVLTLGIMVVSMNSFVLKLSILVLLIISEWGGGLSFLFKYLSSFFFELSVGGLLIVNG